MSSPAHGRDFGLGVVGESPAGEPGGPTLVALFGVRLHKLCR